MVYLADTNVLLRSIDPLSPMHLIAVNAISTLFAQGDKLCITAQNLIEFWSVATRLQSHNGLGLNPVQAEVEVQSFRAKFRLLQDKPEVLIHWEQLVTSLSIRSKQAHDARLVAVMLAHGVTHLLTFNVADFKNYPGIIVVDPSTI